jgi:hypothetical protein
MYNGFIVLGKAENTGNNYDKIGLLTAKFVHYPDCQQLIIWLPESGIEGYENYKLTDISSNTTIESGKVEERLNGSVQLLFDTLCLKDSKYILEIEHPKGGVHVLHFQKHAEATNSNADNVDENPESRNTDTAIKVYKDGMGNIIPDEDILLREKINAQLSQSFNAIVTTSSESYFNIAPDISESADIINQALSFATEWGDNYQKSIISRMHEKYPHLNGQTIIILEAYVKQAELFIYELCQQFIDGRIKETEIIKKSIGNYPWLSAENISRIVGIGNYYASR